MNEPFRRILDGELDVRNGPTISLIEILVAGGPALMRASDEHVNAELSARGAFERAHERH